MKNNLNVNLDINKLKQIEQLDNLKCKCGNHTFKNTYIFFDYFDPRTMKNVIVNTEVIVCKKCNSVPLEMYKDFTKFEQEHKDKIYYCSCGCKTYEVEIIVKKNKLSLIPGLPENIIFSNIICTKCKKSFEPNKPNQNPNNNQNNNTDKTSKIITLNK